MGGSRARWGARSVVSCAAQLAGALLCLRAESLAQAPVVGFDAAPTTRVLRFSREHERLVGRDAPSLEVFGDGRVVAHRPSYMLQPGDHEWRLGPGELQGLIAALAADGLLDYNEDEVERGKRDFRATEARAGRAWTVTDETRTILEIDLISYDARGGAAIGRVRKTIRGHNLQLDSEHMPGLAGLAGMARIERRLLQLEKEAVGRGRKR